ncbi:hypothetical protein TKK_0006300 [Trichogramma kaykai]
MESSGSFNCDVRVKEEPSDASLSENNYKIIDEKPHLKYAQLLPFPQKNSTHTLRKCDIKFEKELDEEVEVVVECEDVQPNINLLEVEIIVDDTRNHLQNAKNSNFI